MPKYRKIPVVIDAWSFDQERIRGEAGEVPGWIREAMRADIVTLTADGWYVQTLESGELAPRHKISDGDWIIRGVEGELYPCKPSIFEATYELAE